MYLHQGLKVVGLVECKGVGDKSCLILWYFQIKMSQLFKKLYTAQKKWDGTKQPSITIE